MTSIEALINRQMMRWESDQRKPVEQQPVSRPGPPPIITVSRQTGSRGSYFASRLALKLDYQRIHGEVVDAICASTGYRKRIIESLDEHYRSRLDLLVESIFSGKVVDTSDYTRHLCRVVLSMARLGGVVLVGRGGNFILGPHQGLHLRFIAPKARRIRNLMTYKGMSPIEAEEMIDESDRKRKQFIHKVFGADIDDPSHYDIVINADCIDVEELVDSAVVAYQGKCNKLANLEND